MARVVTSDNVQPRIRPFFYLVEDELKYLPEQPDYADAYCRVLGVKRWHADSPYTASRFTRSPCLASPLAGSRGISAGSHGEAMFSQAQMPAKIQGSSAAGLHVTTTARATPRQRP
jgi:hypothetical protein